MQLHICKVIDQRPDYKWSLPLIHLSVWTILFILPYILLRGDIALNHMLHIAWLHLLGYAIIFYLNYFVLFDRLFNRRHWAYFILINIVLIVLVNWLNHEVREWIMQNRVFPGGEGLKPPPPPDAMPIPPGGFPPSVMKRKGPGPPMGWIFYIDTLASVLPVIFAVALKLAEKWLLTEQKNIQAQRDHLDAELQHLKYQLQPHFFFNSLNNIYSLVDISPQLAKKSIHSLSKLMRYMLYETDTREVSLREEIHFLQQYISLMELRLAHGNKVITDFPAEIPDVRIAPLIFIALIENAFKHGISAARESEIYFRITLEESEIRFHSENINFAKGEEDRSGSGIGLVNLKKRLDLLYPGKYSLEIREVEGKYITDLMIDIR